MMDTGTHRMSHISILLIGCMVSCHIVATSAHYEALQASDNTGLVRIDDTGIRRNDNIRMDHTRLTGNIREVDDIRTTDDNRRIDNTGFRRIDASRRNINIAVNDNTRINDNFSATDDIRKTGELGIERIDDTGFRRTDAIRRNINIRVYDNTRVNDNFSATDDIRKTDESDIERMDKTGVRRADNINKTNESTKSSDMGEVKPVFYSKIQNSKLLDRHTYYLIDIKEDTQDTSRRPLIQMHYIGTKLKPHGNTEMNINSSGNTEMNQVHPISDEFKHSEQGKDLKDRPMTPDQSKLSRQHYNQFYKETNDPTRTKLSTSANQNQAESYNSPVTMTTPLTTFNQKTLFVPSSRLARVLTTVDPRYTITTKTTEVPVYVYPTQNDQNSNYYRSSKNGMIEGRSQLTQDLTTTNVKKYINQQTSEAPAEFSKHRTPEKTNSSAQLENISSDSKPALKNLNEKSRPTCPDRHSSWTGIWCHLVNYKETTTERGHYGGGGYHSGYDGGKGHHSGGSGGGYGGGGGALIRIANYVPKSKKSSPSCPDGYKWFENKCREIYSNRNKTEADQNQIAQIQQSGAENSLMGLNENTVAVRKTPPSCPKGYKWFENKCRAYYRQYSKRRM